LKRVKKASFLYKPFCAKFYGKFNSEIRNILASIVFKLLKKH
jgi:hypothetical protein